MLKGLTLDCASVTAEARRLNQMYLDEMRNAPADTTLGRMRDYWWSAFISSYQVDGAAIALDQANVYMKAREPEFREVAAEHAASRSEPGSARYFTSQSNFVKSNIGKMFERFAGPALAYCLLDLDAAYCVLPFRTEMAGLIPGKSYDSFRVNFRFGDGMLYTHIDADAFAFNPTDSDADIFMMSMKSTLKDRFHNVPFWNLLRRAAVSADFPEVVPIDRDTLKRLRYVAICSDFAEEQPDFGTESGARNLLQVDASLLDGAYVTSSRARGLPADCTNHLGEVRQHAFYRYSCLFHHLAGSS